MKANLIRPLPTQQVKTLSNNAAGQSLRVDDLGCATIIHKAVMAHEAVHHATFEKAHAEVSPFCDNAAKKRLTTVT